jgi:hypothetical protein
VPRVYWHNFASPFVKDQENAEHQASSACRVVPFQLFALEPRPDRAGFMPF